MTNISFDPVQIECMMLQKLGDANFLLGSNGAPVAKKAEHWSLAEKYYREHLSVDKVNLHSADRLCGILRETSRMQEANLITVQLVNKYPNYGIGWFNLAQGELLAKRYVTAGLFYKQALKVMPEHKESLHNLGQLEKMGHV